jgi:hypothetical protein
MLFSWKSGFDSRSQFPREVSAQHLHSITPNTHEFTSHRYHKVNCHVELFHHDESLNHVNYLTDIFRSVSSVCQSVPKRDSVSPSFYYGSHLQQSNWSDKLINYLIGSFVSSVNPHKLIHFRSLEYSV